MANVRVARQGAWLRVGMSSPPAPVPDPDPGPPSPDPSPPAFQHGADIPALSNEVTGLIGPTGQLVPYTGPTTLSGTVVIENRQLNGNILTLSAGADVTLRNCRLIGPLGATTHTIRAAAGGILRLIDCEIVARTVDNLTPRCVYMLGDGALWAQRTIFRGGIDNLFLGTRSMPGPWATDDPHVPNARILIEDCWFGDLQRVPGSHSDNIQMDPASYAVIRRSRIMCYNIPQGADPLTTRVTDPATAEMASGGLIITRSANPQPGHYYAVRDCWAEGGNYTMDLTAIQSGQPTTDHLHVTNNQFGVRHRYGALRVGPAVRSGNVWGQSGLTACCGPVATGQPLQGG